MGKERLVLLTKGNRTLLVQNPTKKQMKRYKKKSWVESANGEAEKFSSAVAAILKGAPGEGDTSGSS